MFNSTELIMSIDRELYELRTGNNTNTAALIIGFNKNQPGYFLNGPRIWNFNTYQLTKLIHIEPKQSDRDPLTVYLAKHLLVK